MELSASGFPLNIEYYYINEEDFLNFKKQLDFSEISKDSTVDSEKLEKVSKDSTDESDKPASDSSEERGLKRKAVGSPNTSLERAMKRARVEELEKQKDEALAIAAAFEKQIQKLKTPESIAKTLKYDSTGRRKQPFTSLENSPEKAKRLDRSPVACFDERLFLLGSENQEKREASPEIHQRQRFPRRVKTVDSLGTRRKLAFLPKPPESPRASPPSPQSELDENFNDFSFDEEGRVVKVPETPPAKFKMARSPIKLPEQVKVLTPLPVPLELLMPSAPSPKKDEPPFALFSSLKREKVKTSQTLLLHSVEIKVSKLDERLKADRLKLEKLADIFYQKKDQRVAQFCSRYFYEHLSYQDIRLLWDAEPRELYRTFVDQERDYYTKKGISETSIASYEVFRSVGNQCAHEWIEREYIRKKFSDEFFSQVFGSKEELPLVDPNLDKEWRALRQRESDIFTQIFICAVEGKECENEPQLRKELSEIEKVERLTPQDNWEFANLFLRGEMIKDVLLSRDYIRAARQILSAPNEMEKRKEIVRLVQDIKGIMYIDGPNV